MTEPAISVGVVGLGYWGPNLARNFAVVPGSELAWCCDSSPEAQSRIRTAFPSVRVASDVDQLLRDPGLDAIAIATPVPSHAELAVRVLDAGKHCLVEKPVCHDYRDVWRAHALASEVCTQASSESCSRPIL
jgi:predicted dehydrogenase